MPKSFPPRFYRIFGLGLSVTSDDPTVAAALDARLSHFASNSADTSDVIVQIRSVDSPRAHQIGPPSGTGRPVYEVPDGDVRYFEDDDLLYIEFASLARVYGALASGLIEMSIVADGSYSAWLASHPLFTLPFIEVLKRRGFYNLHSAGLSMGDEGILLPGTSGSGKSTLALALLRAGFGFLGDDFLFLTAFGSECRALAFPDEIDLTAETIDLFPELRSQALLSRRTGWPKYQLAVGAQSGAPIVSSCRPSVLIFPQVAHQPRSVLRPIGPDEALLELAPNVLLTDPEASRAHLKTVAALVNQTRCYRLETGRDFDRLPSILSELMSHGTRNRTSGVTPALAGAETNTRW